MARSARPHTLDERYPCRLYVRGFLLNGSVPRQNGSWELGTVRREDRKNE